MGKYTDYQREYQYYRRAKNDRIEFDVPKGGKDILQAVALMHRLTMAQVMRRLLLRSAGLKRWPDDDMMEKIRDAGTEIEARAVLAEAARRERAEDEQVRRKEGRA